MVQLEQKQAKQARPKLLEPEALPTIEFERPLAHGWYSVVFPKVHDRVGNLDMWFRDVSALVNAESKHPTFSLFAHGIGKKPEITERISPVFMFKDLMEAMHIVWRCNGELATPLNIGDGRA